MNRQPAAELRITAMPAGAVLRQVGPNLSCAGCHGAINKMQNVNNWAASHMHNTDVFLDPGHRNIVNGNGW